MGKRSDWSIADIAKEAKSYQTRGAFNCGSRSAYKAATNLGILNEVCSHMAISPRYSYVKWNKESATLEASKYTSRSEFKCQNSGAYCYLLDNMLLDLACSHMPDTYVQWDVQSVSDVAKKYKTKLDFIKGNGSAFKFAKKIGILNDVCAHMSLKRSWTKSDVIFEAKKYQSRSDLFFAMPGAYKHAIKHGYWDEACSHMEVKKRPMDKAMSMEEAVKYQTRAEFQELDGGAYVFARKNGFLDEACAHMIDGDNGFNSKKPAVLYCIEFTVPSGDTLFKIGITNRSAKLRIRGLGLHSGVKASILREIKFKIGADARAKEKAIHKDMAEYQYLGDPIMENGNTEVFCRDAIKYM